MGTTRQEQATELLNNNLFTEMVDAKLATCYTEWLNVAEGTPEARHFRAMAHVYADLKKTVMQIAANVEEGSDGVIVQ